MHRSPVLGGGDVDDVIQLLIGGSTCRRIARFRSPDSADSSWSSASWCNLNPVTCGSEPRAAASAIPTRTVEGLRPDPSQPMVPEHEVVGVIDAVGDGVTQRRVGDRVGVGFLGGHCGECLWCRQGDFVNCDSQPQTGITVDGGYAEVVYARGTGLVRIPDSLPPVDASPLLCAGITTYNPLQKLNAEPDSLVAIQGIGGLGHLGL